MTIKRRALIVALIGGLVLTLSPIRNWIASVFPRSAHADGVSPLLRFSEKWMHPDSTTTPVSLAEIEAAEQELGVRFPKSYRDQLVDVGMPFPTLALLFAISDNRYDLNDLGEFTAPGDIFAETVGWRKIGMPDHLIIIATDSLGNKFCFDQNELKNERKGAAIYFWDHDFNSTDKVAASFDAWIELYLGRWAKGVSALDF